MAWFASLLLALLCWATPAHALDVPPLRAHVNDNADMLSLAAEQRLEQMLARYESKTQQQFALLTVQSLEGDSLEDFSMRVVDAWQLGRKGKDDGLLLLIVKADRQLRIEVGYGLEGDVTDAFSSRVIRNVLTPALRSGRAEQGVEQAFQALTQKASGQAVDAEQLAPAGETAQGPSWFGVFALLLALLPLLLAWLLGRGRGGGLLGGVAGVILGGFGGVGGQSSGRGGFSGGGGGFGGGGSSGSW